MRQKIWDWNSVNGLNFVSAPIFVEPDHPNNPVYKIFLQAQWINNRDIKILQIIGFPSKSPK